METLLTDLAKIILGGLIGGGIVAWIEWKRFRRQQSEWARSDRKLELKIISAEYWEYRWSVKRASSKDEELRLYKAKLDGKLHEWNYLVKVSVTNTTSAELLALAADLETPGFRIEKVEIEEEYRRSQEPPRRIIYDLLSKQVLEEVDFPLAIPSKSAAGFVFLGGWTFDAPIAVEKMPETATFKLTLDDGSEHTATVSLELEQNPDIRYTPEGKIVWAAHDLKYGDLPPAEEEIPF